jgi:hypothetical protein
MAALVTTPKANADAPTLQLAVTVAVTAMGPDAVPAHASWAQQAKATVKAVRVKKRGLICVGSCWGMCMGVFRGW